MTLPLEIPPSFLLQEQKNNKDDLFYEKSITGYKILKREKLLDERRAKKKSESESESLGFFFDRHACDTFRTVKRSVNVLALAWVQALAGHCIVFLGKTLYSFSASQQTIE